MATSKKSIGKKSKGQTSSQVVTPANRSAKQANAKARKTRDTSGHGYEQPLANYDPTTQSWKMCLDTSLWEEPKSLERLPKSGMTRNGVLYQQPDWVPIISEKESSSWPTPTAVTRPMEGNVRKFRALVNAGQMTETEANAILGKSVWEAQGKVPALWPTPTTQETEHPDAIWNQHNRRVSSTGSTHSMNLADAVKRWPTPRAAQAQTRNHTIYVRESGKPQNLENRIAQREPQAIGGKLNPTWVEWLMGFPTGWTDLED